MKKRIEVDVDHWRNISGSLEEYAAWIVSKQPSSEIGDLSSSSSVEEALNKKANDCGMLLVEMEAKQSVIETALESSAEAIKSFKKLGVEETTLESSTQAVLENLKDRQAETKVGTNPQSYNLFSSRTHGVVSELMLMHEKSSFFEKSNP